jgi:hypothetical protein
VPPRRRERRQHVVERSVEQVAQRDMAQAPLGLGRARDEHLRAPRLRVLDGSVQQRRLADARLALEHECRRPCPGVVDEPGQGSELLGSPDDRRHGLLRRS